jgi:hypothetical protein
MTLIDPSPKAIKNMLVQVGTNQYEKAVSSCKFTPTAPSAVEFRGGTPDAVYTDQGSATWAAVITAAQDWEDEDSFVNFCLDHEGESATITYKPDAAGAFGLTATITIVAPEVGGDIGAFPTTTLTMPCNQKPTRVPVV